MEGENERFQNGSIYLDFERVAREAGFQVHELGRIEKYPLLMIASEAPSPETPRCYLSAGIHGDEPAGSIAILELLSNPPAHAGIAWTLFPALNPVGLAQGRRVNGQGVDLNRDYLALSCQETQLHVKWLRRQNRGHDLILSLHEDWEATGFYHYEINNSEQDSISDVIHEAVVPLIPLEVGPTVDGHPLDRPGLIRHVPEPDEPMGWPEAIYHSKQFPSRSYTLETPSTLPLALRVQAHLAAVRAAVATLLP